MPDHPTICSIPECTKPYSARGYCEPHYLRWYKYGAPEYVPPPKKLAPVAERFWGKVDKNGPVAAQRPDLGPCWLWIGGIGGGGYGRFKLARPRRQIGAHLWAWEALNGTVPAGLQLDHLCRTRHCVRPSHLEAVTGRVNTLRGDTIVARNAAVTHCPNGHVYDAANTYLNPRGSRVCRACARKACLDLYYRKKRAG